MSSSVFLTCPQFLQWNQWLRLYNLLTLSPIKSYQLYHFLTFFIVFYHFLTYASLFYFFLFVNGRAYTKVLYTTTPSPAPSISTGRVIHRLSTAVRLYSTKSLLRVMRVMRYLWYMRVSERIESEGQWCTLYWILIQSYTVHLNSTYTVNLYSTYTDR